MTSQTSRMTVTLKSATSLLLIASLSLAISHTNNPAWLLAWFILFFLVAMPLSLFTLKDIVSMVVPGGLLPSHKILQLCAILAGVIGYILGVLAVN